MPGLIDAANVTAVPFSIRRRDRHPLTNVSSLLVCGLLAGVVVAAAAFPAATISGLAAKASAQEFTNLPSELKQQTSPQLSRIYASDGKTQIAVMYDEYRSDVPLKDISVNMQHAIIAAEDHKYYEHHGVDFKGLARAFVNNQGGGDQQGASTLTMQTVRMSLAYSATSASEVVAATAKTPERKVAEMKYALELEKQLNKEQILERYLNIAPFGNAAYGIYAASQVYFGKKPKDLDVAESALLAGMVKGTSWYDPTSTEGYPRAVERRNYVVNDMLTLKFITADQATKAKTEKVPNKTKPVGNGCTSVSQNEWGFFCDYFQRWWLSQPAFGENSYDRERRLKSGGYRIVTTLDVKAQKSARKRILEQTKDNSVNALLLAAVQPGTGKVRALAANRKFKLPTADKPNPLSSDPKKKKAGVRATYPNTTNPIITGGGDIHGYQAGSVFKMFTMVAALENGYGLDYNINTTPRYVSPLYRDSAAPAACNGHYCPSNSSDKEKGPFNMWTGFGASVNTYFVPLQEQVGAEKVVDVAERFGITFREQGDLDLALHSAHDWGAFTLGVSASTPLDIANAYATLAGDGMYCAPTPIEQITTHTGEKLDVGKSSCKRVTTPDVARKALDATRCPVGDQAQLGSCGGHATAPQSRGAVGHPVFGKTGTTDSEKTAALVVGTTSIVVAGYLVNPDWQAHTDHMQHGVVNPAVWNTVADYMDGKPDEQFKTPE
ncbi:transglycosylase domain-containing protein [Actinoplanes sp. NPDC026619]|uniref:transglycosylase domain-containing protein n=1 Tax=Actinoplanes sp. NPDC026619 TaxID=3155798 RepID=UPI0033F97906